jgi:hypothetical protein
MHSVPFSKLGVTNQEHYVENNECHGERMEEQVTRGTVGLLNSFQDADRNGNVPIGLWQNLPFTS